MIEDNVWDEFEASDDHIVPHPSNEYVDQYATQGEGRKKSRCEVTGFTNIADNSTIYGIKGMEKNVKMLEKGSWSDTQDNVFPTSCDSDTPKEVTSEASNGSRMSTQGSKNSGSAAKVGEFSEEDHILGDKCVSEDDNVYHYPLNHISQADNDLSFLDSDREDKESSDLLYYGWPDIGNFEDVDRMFRSCDSIFGLGSLSNEEDLCWFSTTNAAEGPEDLLKSGSKLNGLPGHHEASRENGVGASTDDSNEKIFGAGDNINFKCLDTDNSGLNHLSFGNGFDTQSESADDLMFNEAHLQKKQLKHQNKSDGKQKVRLVENGSFTHYDELKQFTDLKHPFGDSSPRVFPTSGLQPHKQNIEQNSMNYIPTHIPYMHLDYSHPSDQISVCPTPSGTKYENNIHTSPSPKESSYASNQVQSMESSHGLSFETPSVTTNDKREKLYHCQDIQAPVTRNFKHANIAGPVEFCSAVSVQKQVQSELGIKGNSEVDGVSIRVPTELVSSNGQESSCMSSVLDEISLEATSFRQLQQVMDKLDIRTKLCIRDSLYRLARSAEQRHNCGNSGAGIRVDREATGALMREETNKGAGFIDMETDTNPIDRSIAHLLFHRPSDSTVMHAAKDAFSFKSQALINGSITSPPVNGEKQVCSEETTNYAGKNLLTTDNK